MRKQSIIHKVLKWSVFLVISLIGVYASLALADDNLGNIATDITGSFSSIGKLMLAVAYLAGIGFAIAAIFKFKQHRDNPTQIPIGTPVTLLAVGVILIFLPGIIGPAGQTIFGANATNYAGGFTGGGATNIPGGKDAT